MTAWRALIGQLASEYLDCHPGAKAYSIAKHIRDEYQAMSEEKRPKDVLSHLSGWEKSGILTREINKVVADYRGE